MEKNKRCPLCRSEVREGKCAQTRRATCPYREKIERPETEEKSK